MKSSSVRKYVCTKREQIKELTITQKMENDGRFWKWKVMVYLSKNCSWELNLLLLILSEGEIDELNLGSPNALGWSVMDYF